MKKFHWIMALATALVLVTGAGLFAQEAEEGFISLFNGKDLTGWHKAGGSATYKVEDGAIVGECVPNTPNNTFLCSDQEFGNFIFKCDFKAEVPGNSGVQFRSHVRQDGDSQTVFGYQCEIDPGDAFETGRIYDESRRGHQNGIVWLNDVPAELHNAAKASYKPGDWNSIEIQCVGPSIRTWINGNPVTNTFDYMNMKGFFGLQIHAGTQGKFLWKNIRIKDLGVSEWKKFFDKNKNGEWELVDCYEYVPSCWKFSTEDGHEVLWGHHTADEARDGLVVSCHNYKDFVARVNYKIDGGNSALYFRAAEVKTPWLLRGYQNEIAGNEAEAGIWHTAGERTDPPGRGWLGRNDDLVKKIRHDKGWNEVATVALDDHVITFLNGYKIVDMNDPQGEKNGKLALQLHGGAEDDMWFYDFEVIEITPEMKELILR